MKPVYIPVSFCAGFSIMAVEMTSARALAPYFGTSIFIWAALVSSVMICIFLGNYAGGVLSGKFNPGKILTICLFTAVILCNTCSCGCISILSFIFRNGYMPAYMMMPLLAGFSMLVSIPLVFVGTSSPLLIASSAGEGDAPGHSAGSVYAWNTAGGLAGTLFPVTSGIPLLGVRASFSIAAASVMLAGIISIFLQAERRSTRISTVLIICASASFTLYAIPSGEKTGTVYKTDSCYNSIKVVRKNAGTRLVLNDDFAVHSIDYDDKSRLHYDVWSLYCVCPWMRNGTHPLPSARVLFAGLGAATAASYYSRYFPSYSLSGIEIDPEIVNVAEKYFSMNRSTISIHIDDIRRHLYSDSSRYDIIIVDAFSFPYIPAHLATIEFMDLLHSRMTPDGMVLFNTGRYRDRDDTVRCIARTASCIFRNVYVYRVRNDYNSLVFMSDMPLDEKTGHGINNGDELQQLANIVRRSMKKYLESPEDYISTDNRPLSDYLTNRIVVNSIMDVLK